MFLTTNLLLIILARHVSNGQNYDINIVRYHPFKIAIAHTFFCIVNLYYIPLFLIDVLLNETLTFHPPMFSSTYKNHLELKFLNSNTHFMRYICVVITQRYSIQVCVRNAKDCIVNSRSELVSPSEARLTTYLVMKYFF